MSVREHKESIFTQELEGFDSPAINIKSWPKINATLDGNNGCDSA